MNVKLAGTLFVAALLVTAAAPTFAAGDATVGEFVIKLAKTRNLAATDARVAGNALRGVGVRVPTDLNYSKKLTEGDVALLSRSFGLNVTTATPDTLFTTDQVDRFFATFDVGIINLDEGNTTRNHDGGPAFDPYSKGKGGSKGKKKGHDFTPTEPE